MTEIKPEDIFIPAIIKEKPKAKKKKTKVYRDDFPTTEQSIKDYFADCDFNGMCTDD
jgi:hypothetical protein